jgi:antirestriction protein ArdC
VIIAPRGQDRAGFYRRLRELTDTLWRELGDELNFKLVVSHDAFVTYDGRGNVGIAPYDQLDEDDLFAQIVFHELCHWRCEGIRSREQPDWGLDNTSQQDVHAEHAALILQARWSSQHALTDVLIPTTDFRPWYESLPADPWRMETAAARHADKAWSSLDPAFALIDTALAVTARHARELCVA